MKNIFRIMTTFNSQGRATRRDFLAVTFIVPLVYTFIYMIITILAVPLTKIIGSDMFSMVILLFTLIIIIHYIIISYAILVRRLHDSGKSGIYYLVAFIPIIGSFLLFIILLSPPTVGPNIYGPDPRELQ